MNLFDLSAKLSLDSGAFEAGISAAKSVVNGFSKATKIAMAAAMAAFTKFATSAVQTGMQFDSAMSQVAATMGVSVDEIKELREFAKEMGATTAFSATQAAEALNYMALAGYDAEKSMKMLPTVLNLAAAGGFDLADASDMVTDAQSALGLSIEETSTMVNQMAKTAARSNTSVKQLGDAMLTIGGTAKFMAGGTDRLQTVLGLLADNGIKGSEAGTHLRNMLLKLSSPTESGKKVMEKFGLAVFDAEGNMRDMQDIMLDLSKALDTVTNEERVQAISDLFNSRDLSAVNALLGTSKERWDELGASILEAKGSAEKMAGTQLGNLSGDITLMKSALEGVRIEFSEGITPAIRDIIQRITKVLSNSKTQKFLNDLGKKLGNVLTHIMRFVSQKAFPTLVRLFDDGGKKIKTFAAVLGGLIFTVKLATNPIGTLAFAIGAIVGVFKLWDEEIKNIDWALEGLSDKQWETVKDARDAADAYSDAIDTYNDAVNSIDDDMGNVRNAWQELQGYINENGEVTEGYESKVDSLLGVINSGLDTQYERQGNVIAQYAEMEAAIDSLIEKKQVERMLEAKQELYNNAKKNLELERERLGTANDALKTAQEELETRQKAYDTYVEEHDLAGALAARYSDDAEARKDAERALSRHTIALAVMNQEIENAKNKVAAQQEEIQKSTSQIDTYIRDIDRYDRAWEASVEGNFDLAKNLLEDDIVERWKHKQRVSTINQEELDEMNREYRAKYAYYQHYREQYLAGEEGYTKEEFARLRDEILELNGILSDEMLKAKKEAWRIGENIGNAVVSGLRSVQETAATTAQSFINNGIVRPMKVTAQIKSPSRVARAIGQNIGSALSLGLDDEISNAVQSAENLSNNVFDALDEPYETSTYVEKTDDGGKNESVVIGLLREIRDNLGFDMVLQDGTLVGRIDKLLGQAAMRKARGNA